MDPNYQKDILLALIKVADIFGRIRTPIEKVLQDAELDSASAIYAFNYLRDIGAIRLIFAHPPAVVITHKLNWRVIGYSWWFKLIYHKIRRGILWLLGV